MNITVAVRLHIFAMLTIRFHGKFTFRMGEGYYSVFQHTPHMSGKACWETGTHTERCKKISTTVNASMMVRR